MFKIQIQLCNAPIRRPRARVFLAAVAIVGLVPIAVLAAPVDLPNQFSAGDPISAEAFNENFEALADAVNDNDSRIIDVEEQMDGVPSGAVMFFNLAECPADWTEMADLRGRVPVGLAEGGSLASVVGSELEDEGTRTISTVPSHTHASGTLSASLSSAGSHSHSNSSAGSHGHTMQTGGSHTHTMQSGGLHDHNIFLETAGNFGTGFIMGTVNQAGGALSSNAVQNDGFHTHTINSAGTHSHTINNAGSHSHTIGSGGSHTHTATMAGSTAVSGTAAVDVTMPYVQLLACSKD